MCALRKSLHVIDFKGLLVVIIAISTGGLSYGSKIGIGVGIGVGGTLVLIGILFAVLCRRHEITKRAKPGF